MPEKSIRTRKTSRPTSPVLPAHSDIAARAYELFLQRGAQHGQDWNDWLSAERELAAFAAAMVRRTPTPPRQERAAGTPDEGETARRPAVQRRRKRASGEAAST